MKLSRALIGERPKFQAGDSVVMEIDAHESGRGGAELWLARWQVLRDSLTHSVLQKSPIPSSRITDPSGDFDSSEFLVVSVGGYWIYGDMMGLC